MAIGALEKMGTLLARHGLSLHPEKTRIVDFDKGFRFLGHVFVRGMAWQEAARLDATPDDGALRAAADALEVWQAVADAPAPIPDPIHDKPQRGRWAPRQRVMYVLEPGRRLSVQGESFVVLEADGGAPIVRIPHQRLDRIELSQVALVDADALDLAAASDVTILRIDGYGQAIGRWSARAGGNAERHLAQCALTLDHDRRIAQARLIVGTRIRNQRVQLKRMSRSRPEGDLSKTTAKLAALIRQVERKPDLEIAEIMGFEGAASALYWPAISHLLARPELFAGRRRRRAGHDPLNCLMDVLAGILTRDITVAIERAGLHPGIGVLHTTTAGSDALVFDLIEAFRAPILEACAFAMIGRGAITPEHFAKTSQSWKLTREGWAVAIRQYEAWVQRPILSPHSGQKVLWRGLFEEEALAFAQAIETKEAFTPYRMDW
jgi:CRISP-associated protein Cas1